MTPQKITFLGIYIILLSVAASLAQTNFDTKKAINYLQKRIKDNLPNYNNFKNIFGISKNENFDDYRIASMKARINNLSNEVAFLSNNPNDYQISFKLMKIDNIEIQLEKLSLKSYDVIITQTILSYKIKSFLPFQLEKDIILNYEYQLLNLEQSYNDIIREQLNENIATAILTKENRQNEEQEKQIISETHNFENRVLNVMSLKEALFLLVPNRNYISQIFIKQQKLIQSILLTGWIKISLEGQFCRFKKDAKQSNIFLNFYNKKHITIEKMNSVGVNKYFFKTLLISNEEHPFQSSQVLV